MNELIYHMKFTTCYEDLSYARTHHGFYTEGSQVIVQGYMRDGVFQVQVYIYAFTTSLE